MSEGLLGTIISAVIAGIFSLIAKRMELSRRQDREAKASASPGAAADIQPAAAAINPATVLLHIGILQFVINLIGFIVGLAMGATGATQDTVILTILVIGTIVASAGFFWSALVVDKVVRWKHLALVAVGVAITTLIINSILLETPITVYTVGFALVQTFISMGIGGFVANSVKR